MKNYHRALQEVVRQCIAEISEGHNPAIAVASAVTKGYELGQEAKAAINKLAKDLAEEEEAG